jgi:hypothetical protein
VPHHHYLIHTLLPALVPFLGVSATSGLVAAGLLVFGVVEGTAATAAWTSVALSAISFLGVLVRIVANDRKATREFDAELRQLRAENLSLHAKDADQERQLKALRQAVRANSANIDTLAGVSGSDIRPALRPVDPGSTTLGPPPALPPSPPGAAAAP